MGSRRTWSLVRRFVLAVDLFEARNDVLRNPFELLQALSPSADVLGLAALRRGPASFVNRTKPFSLLKLAEKSVCRLLISFLTSLNSFLFSSLNANPFRLRCSRSFSNNRLPSGESEDGSVEASTAWRAWKTSRREDASTSYSLSSFSPSTAALRSASSGETY